MSRSFPLFLLQRSRSGWRQRLFVGVVLGSQCVVLRADPPEDVNAWPDAPVGFQWGELGPRTEEVDASQYAGVHHVSVATGSDQTGDGSAGKPWQSLQHALAAAPSDGRSAILVAAGKYMEGTLTMRERVDLYGGFDARDWQRDILRQPTILSGRQRNRVLVGADDCRLDGFIIEDGLVRDHGAGMLCRQVSPIITNNVFRRNRAEGPADFSHDNSRRRQRGHNGGAIGLVNYANPDIRNNLFLENEAAIGNGGAIGARDDCIPRIGFNVFWANRAGAADTNTTRSSNGGAVALLNSSRGGVFANLFVANQALGGSDAGALFCEYFSWPEIRYNAFLNNYADDDGGAIDNQKFSWPKVHANLFYGNHVGGSGGAMHLDDSVVEMENNVFAFNRAGFEAGGFGGTHGWFRAVNNTVVFNEAADAGGGIHLVNVKNPFLRPSIIQNNILWGNRDDQVKFEGETIFHYNIIEGGYPEAYASYNLDPGFREDGASWTIRGVSREPATFQTRIELSGTIDAEPAVGRVIRIGEFWSMVSAVSGSTTTIWGLLPDDAGPEGELLPTFHLRPGSNAINRGVYTDFAAEDIDGEPRYTPNIDVGADEYRAP